MLADGSDDAAWSGVVQASATGQASTGERRPEGWQRVGDSMVLQSGGSWAQGGGIPRQAGPRTGAAVAARTAVVLIDLLAPSDSPRVRGESDEHVRMLAELDAPLPPILVHRRTMRVVDGMHRLLAAKLRGDRSIAVQYCDGDAHALFLRAVEANNAHGLPLSSADREVAAARIVRSHPRLSDRAIAVSAGLAVRTVADIRRRVLGSDSDGDVRIGRDGRARPLSSADGRRRAAAVLAERPAATLREVAASAGVSLGTARDVRERLRRGEHPLPDRVRLAARLPDSVSGGTGPAVDRPGLLDTLRGDPAIRQTEAGRFLLRLLSVQAVTSDDWEALLESVPAHCLPSIAALADNCAQTWSRVAAEVGQLVRSST